MKQLRPLLIAVLLVASFSANAKSDIYYSQGIDIDFGLASESDTLKTTLEGVVTRLLEFISPIDDDSMAIDFDYYFDMHGELDE